MNSIRDERLNRWLRLALVLGGLLYLGVYFVIVAKRIGYPYELEWMEGGSVDHVRRIASGLPLYARPSIDFVAFIYPPLYFYISSFVASFVGDGFLPLRLVAAASSVGVFALLFAFVRRETGRWSDGLLAAGLFAASYAASDGWFDIGRVDSTFLLFVLAAIYLIRFHRGIAGGALAGLFIGLAYATKQTAIVALAPMVLYAFIADRRRALVLLGSAAVFIVAGYAVFTNIFGEWYAYYVYRVPSAHPWLWGDLFVFWTRDLLPYGAIALLISTPFLVSRFREAQSGERWFYPLLLVGAIGAAWISRLHVGGHINVMMPAHAAVAMLLPVALRWWAARPSQSAELSGPAGAMGRAETYILVAALVQLGMWYYNPRTFIPAHTDREAGDRLIAALAAIDGDVFLPDHSYLGVLAGKRSNAQSQAVLDILRSDDSAGARALMSEITAAIGSGRYAAVVPDEGCLYDRVAPGDGWFTAMLESRYGAPQRIAYRSNEFLPVVGMKSRPLYIYSLSGAGLRPNGAGPTAPR